MYNNKILIIDDEQPISDLLSYSLSKEGFITKAAYDGVTGLNLIKEFMPDLIILDLMLPDTSGFDICKKISTDYNIPIVMITAKCDTIDKIIGMELGADDYITKPFDIREVLVRIKAIFRRIELTEGYNNLDTLKPIHIPNNIEIYKYKREVLKNNEKVSLTNKEYDLLLFLSENRGRVFTRDNLLDKVWGYEYLGDTRTVDIHIQRLRKKLDDPNKTSIFGTVFGIGYKLI